MTNPTRADSGGVGVKKPVSASTSPTLPATTDETPRPRFCTFTNVWCRCGVDDLESVTMHVCARHFMHEAVSG